jgi:hypothetical protein
LRLEMVDNNGIYIFIYYLFHFLHLLPAFPNGIARERDTRSLNEERRKKLRMNRKAKGSRNERRSWLLVEAAGYKVTRAKENNCRPDISMIPLIHSLAG